MGKGKNKPITNLIIGFLLVWVLLPNISGLFLFSVLVLTQQIEYHSPAHDPRIPLAYAIKFNYTPSSILRLMPIAGFSSGILIAVNPNKSATRPGVILHELRHTQQRLLGGPFFIPTYSEFNRLHRQAGSSIWETYLSNPFERDAYHFSGEQTKYNELIDQHAPKLTRLKL